MSKKKPMSQGVVKDLIVSFGENCGDGIETAIGYVLLAFLILTCVIAPIIGIVLLICGD